MTLDKTRKQAAKKWLDENWTACGWSNEDVVTAYLSGYDACATIKDREIAELKKRDENLRPEEYALLASLRSQIDELREEVDEQARLNGMGSEREARLLAEVATLKKELKNIEVNTKDNWAAARAQYALGIGKVGILSDE